MNFAGKTVLITGSGSGIGRAAALAFAREGANVVTNATTDAKRGVSDEINANGGKSIFVAADVSTAEGVDRIFKAAIAAFGQIDVVVNAAGIVPEGNIEVCTEEEWDRAMCVNVKGVYLVANRAIPYLRKTKGAMVNITSTVAIKGVANRAAYSATKGAVLSLSRSMAAEYVGEGIRVNCVCPGTVYSPSFQQRVNAAPDPEQAMKNYIARQPMGRLGTPEEIAEAILFAANPNVGFMTGANIVVDGAMTV